MKKPLFSAVLAAAIAAGAVMAPAFAEGTSKDKVKSYHLKKVKNDPAEAKNNAIKDDYYKSAREMQMKISM
jgi:uncharacterized membrane protein